MKYLKSIWFAFLIYIYIFIKIAFRGILLNPVPQSLYAQLENISNVI